MKQPIVYPPSVIAALNGDGPTPSLEDFVAGAKQDDTLFWRLPQGHINNLLEDAIERLGLWEESQEVAVPGQNSPE